MLVGANANEIQTPLIEGHCNVSNHFFYARVL